MENLPKYVFVEHEDGYFVYRDGRYAGKDDQMDLVDLLLDVKAAVVFSPEDLDCDLMYCPPDNLDDWEPYL